MTIGASALGIDPYGFADMHLSAPARAALAELAGVLDRDVRPLMADAWETATMPDGVLRCVSANP